LPPPAKEGEIRVDTGVYEGGEISMHYDSMIAKLITHGANREQAIERMRNALDAFVIRGVASNIPFQAALMQHPRFVSGKFNTGFIAEEFPKGFQVTDVKVEDPLLFVSVAASIHARRLARDASISGQLPGHAHVPSNGLVAQIGEEKYAVSVVQRSPQQRVAIGSRTYDVQSDWRFGEPLFTGTVNGRLVRVQVDRLGPVYRLFHSGVQVDVRMMSALAAE